MTFKRHDPYFKRAKQAGYRSRAAYKLLELQQRFRLMNFADTVVDLGAAPGGWVQVAAKIVGPKGRVIGVDLQFIEAFPQANVTLIQQDITSADIGDTIKGLIAERAHCVLSDLAPKLSGIRDSDAARSLSLNQSALAVATQILRPGGALLMKSFMSDELHGFTLELKRWFTTVARTRPEATRQTSSEFYFCAKGFRSETPA